jgi:F-type H+-transporting ATPase subunit b
MLTFPPDFSFVIQVISFLLLWWALKRLTFDPVLHVLEEREARTRGGLAEAERTRAEAEAAAEQYESSLREVRHAVLQQTDAARKAAEEEQRRRLDAARAEADAELSRLRSDIAAQVEQAKATLAREAHAIGTLMAERVTGRSLT